METKIKHSEMVAALVKPGEDILKTLTPEDCHSLHMAVGIVGEAGELIDAVKKAVIYRKSLDRDNVIEEIGDIMFYLTGLCQGLDITLDQCLAHNTAKLNTRYAAGKYSDKQAQDRADKQ